MAFASALEYAAKHKPWDVVVSVAGDITARAGDAQGEAHALFSGTKSFWGIAALSAQSDALLRLDEPLATEFPEWNGDDERSTITVEMALSMTAGYGFGGLGNAVPVLDAAIAVPLKDAPGSRFTYGGIPLQVFGAFFTRRLARHGTSPQAYLHERILQPAGVNVERWRQLRDGSHPFPTGAYLNADNWLAYGRYVLAHRGRFARAFIPNTVNERYGLGWWLGLAGVSETLIYASGSGGQGLYLLPERDTVAVHFGEGASYKHEAFVKRLIAAPR